ncbi:S-layer homology domain-containing protein [Abyssisolibacter fermentans]|uniref:S-layer homology domain-containing protein n=1 Tax=Abyssisolibacter fermentans TaxID=1766203 RepID=UPI00082BD08C|nr:S-layer homology domain-containing protein [Abyssisolibacter fermentans]
MREKRIYILVIVFLLLFSTIAFAQDYIAQPIGRIDTDGNSLVWASYVSGEWCVFHADLSTGKQSQITFGDFSASYPSIWGNKIVWQEYRDEKFDIYLYDMDSKTSKKISTLEGNNIESLIRGDYILWANQNDGYKNIVIYDMNTQKEEIVTTEILACGIDFDGEYAVWMDGRNGNMDIYAYDIQNSAEIRVTSDMEDESDPKISEGEIVYTTRYGGTTHLHKYDIEAQEDSKLTAGDEEHNLLAFSAGQIIMTEGDDVILKDTDTTVETDIKTIDNKKPNKTFLNGTDIVWLSDTGIKTDNTNDAIDRADETPKEENPKEENPKEEVPKEEARHSEKRSKEESNESTFSVVPGDDNLFEIEKDKIKILIKADEILSEGEIRFDEIDMNIQDSDYSLKSKIYELNMEESNTQTKTATLLISYGSYKNGNKLRVYSIEDKPKALKLKRNKENQTISVEIQNGMKIALMAHEKEYSDIQKHWAKETIESVAAQQMISGYKDETIRPDNTITRAEFMKILVNYFAKGEEAIGEGFTDISEHWAEKDLIIAKNKGWIKGYDGKAAPDNKITREEMITILMRISAENIEKKEVAMEDFADYSQVSKWSKESITKAIKEGIIQGDNKNIKPKSNATRAEAITIIYRFLDNRGNI